MNISDFTSARTIVVAEAKPDGMFIPMSAYRRNILGMRF